MKNPPTMIPPVLTLVRGLLELGHEVTLFTYHVPDDAVPLGAPGFHLHRVGDEPYPRGLGARIAATARLYRDLFALVRRAPDFDVLWDANGDMRHARRVIRRAGSTAPLIRHVHEYEPRALRTAAEADALVVPEENRGWLLSLATGHRRAPLVLPNAPLRTPTVGETLPPAAHRIRQLRASGRQVVLYQGYIDHERRCLPELIAAMAHVPDSIVLAIMPAPALTDAQRRQLESLSAAVGVSDRLILLDFVSPPQHLAAIAQATAGIGLYRPTSVNQVYCAPNRLYECTAFGVPIVLPAFPGIRPLAERYAAIVVCDPEDPMSIAAAMAEAVDPARRAERAAAGEEFFAKEGDYLTHLRRVLAELPVTGRGP